VSCSQPNHRTREAAPGIVLDARRAVWLAAERVLIVADLHLGYAWAHRSAGNLIPLTRTFDALERLSHLIDAYSPVRTVLLGDIVHDAVDVEPLTVELRRLQEDLGQRTEIVLVAGNHDRRLKALLESKDIGLPLMREWQIGPHRLVHGDGAGLDQAKAEMATAMSRGGLVFCGHEHPAITLSDHVASYTKCPCFVEGDGLLMLPAFSEWAGGSNLRNGNFLSRYLEVAHVRHLTAIIADKLLTLPASGNGSPRIAR
jgi:DNA ligase-associated metallophosphoesterase